MQTKMTFLQKKSSQKLPKILLTNIRKRSLQDDLAYLETLDYNNDTIINDLNNIPSGPSAPKKAKYHK